MKKHKKKRLDHVKNQANYPKREEVKELEKIDKILSISSGSSDEEIQAFLEARRRNQEEQEMRRIEVEKKIEEEKMKEEIMRRIQMEETRKRLEEERVKDEEDKKISDQESNVKQFSISAESSDEEIQAFMDAKHELEKIKKDVQEARSRREKLQFNVEDDFIKLKEKIDEDDLKISGNIKSSSKNFTDKKKPNFLMLAFVLLVIVSYGFSYWKKSLIQSEKTLREKTEKYINENLVQPGTDLKITEFVKEGDLYKFTVEVGGQKVVSYLTGDGKKLLLNPVDLDGQSNDGDSQTKAQAPAPVAEASTKKDIPDVELFVMSYCPYGIQAEKGILPVVEKLKSKINFSIKFVDYTLHGKKEFDENLNQYCIQKEEPEKFNKYLECFAKEGDSSKCSASVNIDQFKNSSCISNTDKQFKLTENFSDSAQSSPFGIYKDLNTKYGVQGSPSLVVNGQLIDSGRDSDSLLKTICSGFNNQPEECKEQLSSANPSPGFGK